MPAWGREYGLGFAVRLCVPIRETLAIHEDRWLWIWGAKRTEKARCDKAAAVYQCRPSNVKFIISFPNPALKCNVSGLSQTRGGETVQGGGGHRPDCSNDKNRPRH